MKRYELKTLFSKEQIHETNKRLALQISNDFKNKHLIMIGILKGSFIFISDLLRELSIPAEIDFVRLSSYGSKTYSSGQIVMSKYIETPIKDKDVLIIDDILDTGFTLKYLYNKLLEEKPNSIQLCALIRRECEHHIEADYVGFNIHKGFIVGYGIDYNEQYRNLPDIQVINFLETEKED